MTKLYLTDQAIRDADDIAALNERRIGTEDHLKAHHPAGLCRADLGVPPARVLPMSSLIYAAKPISFLGVNAEQWSMAAAIATTAGFAIGTVVAIVAVGQFLQSQRVHREQTRPFMIITAEPSPVDQTLVDLVVRNIGTTPAYDLTIAITPRIERVREESGYEIAGARIFNEPIAM